MFRRKFGQKNALNLLWDFSRPKMRANDFLEEKKRKLKIC